MDNKKISLLSAIQKEKKEYLILRQKSKKITPRAKTKETAIAHQEYKLIATNYVDCIKLIRPMIKKYTSKKQLMFLTDLEIHTDIVKINTFFNVQHNHHLKVKSTLTGKLVSKIENKKLKNKSKLLLATQYIIDLIWLIKKAPFSDKSKIKKLTKKTQDYLTIKKYTQCMLTKQEFTKITQTQLRVNYLIQQLKEHKNNAYYIDKDNPFVTKETIKKTIKSGYFVVLKNSNTVENSKLIKQQENDIEIFEEQQEIDIIVQVIDDVMYAVKRIDVYNVTKKIVYKETKTNDKWFEKQHEVLSEGYLRSSYKKLANIDKTPLIIDQHIKATIDYFEQTKQ